MTLSITPGILFPTAPLSAAAAAVVVAPNSLGSGVTLTKVTVSNPMGAAAQFSLWRVPAGGTPVPANAVVPPRSVSAGETVIVPEVNGLVLGPGDMLYASASTAAVLNLTVSGYTFVST